MKVIGHIFAPKKWTRTGVVLIRHQVSDTGHPVRKHRIDDGWVYDYSYTDCGLYRLGDRRPWQSRLAKTGHLYAPGTVFWEKNPYRGKGWRSAYVIFTGGSEVGLDQLVGTTGGFSRFGDPQDVVGNLMKKMADIAEEEKEDGFFRVHSLFMELLDRLLRSQAIGPACFSHSETSEAARTISPLVLKVRQYFEEHLSEPVTLNRLAEHLIMASSTLSHTYPKEAGEPPLTTLRNMRLARAKLMLLARERFKHIAEAIGFCDAYHFSKVFKKAEGVSPRDFIRRYYWKNG